MFLLELIIFLFFTFIQVLLETISIGSLYPLLLSIFNSEKQIFSNDLFSLDIFRQIMIIENKILFFSFLIVLVSFIFEAILNVFREYTPYELDPEISVIKIIGERLGQVPFIILITWLLGFLV